MFECPKCRKELPDGAAWCCWCGAKLMTTRKPRARSNGEGSVYQYGNAGKWRAEINIYKDGVRYHKIRSGFKTKRDAVQALPEMRELVLNGQEFAQDATLQELWEMICAQTLPKLSKDKASHYRTAWAALEPLKNAKIRNLRYAHLQPIVDAREGGYYPKRDIKALLGKMYTLALKYEYADKDYSKLLDLPPISASTRTALTEDEVQRIWQDYDAGHEFSRYWLIMAYTGMRTGEMLTILKANTHLAEQYCTGGIKTDAGKARQIIFPDKIMPLVREAYRSGTKRLCEADEKTFYAEWHDMAQRVGLQPDMTPYCLRHTTATLLAVEKVAPAIIKEVLGHTDYAVTLGYTHHPAGRKAGRDEQVEVISRVQDRCTAFRGTVQHWGSRPTDSQPAPAHGKGWCAMRSARHAGWCFEWPSSHCIACQQSAHRPLSGQLPAGPLVPR